MYGSEAPEADPGGPGGGSGGLGSGFTKALSVGVVVTWRLLMREGRTVKGAYKVLIRSLPNPCKDLVRSLTIQSLRWPHRLLIRTL